MEVADREPRGYGEGETMKSVMDGRARLHVAFTEPHRRVD
jgi:hypothetical protein